LQRPKMCNGHFTRVDYEYFGYYLSKGPTHLSNVLVAAIFITILITRSCRLF